MSSDISLPLKPNFSRADRWYRDFQWSVFQIQTPEPCDYTQLPVRERSEFQIRELLQEMIAAADRFALH
jgi:hypothetical protein